jgi:hypothetical protein
VPGWYLNPFVTSGTYMSRWLRKGYARKCRFINPFFQLIIPCHPASSNHSLIYSLIFCKRQWFTPPTDWLYDTAYRVYVGTLRLILPGFWHLFMNLCYKHNTFRQLDIILSSDKKLGLATFWVPSEVLMSTTGPNLPVCFVMFVCPSIRPSVCTEQLCFHWTDFRDTDIWVFFENLSRKFKFR